MPGPVCQLLYCTIVLFRILYCEIKNVLVLCLFFYVPTICVKNIINLLKHNSM